MLSKLVNRQTSMGKSLTNLLNSSNYERLRMMVAFARFSGIGRLFNDFRNFSNSGGHIEAIIGIDQRWTSLQALEQLNNLSNNNLYIHYDRGASGFHPKVFIFEKEDNINTIIIGSSNLTAGGLFTNYEANVMLTPQGTKDDLEFVSDLDDYYKSILSDRNTKKALPQLISELFTQGLLIDETVNRRFLRTVDRMSVLPFREGRRRQAPPLITSPRAVTIRTPRIFAMTLSRFDVSQRSQDPIILIPIRALKQYPLFWQWPSLFTLSRGGYLERYTPVDVTISHGNILPRYHVRIYYYERRDEFRFQCEPIKRNGRQGDIVAIEKCNTGRTEYKVELVPTNSTRYSGYLRICSSKVSGLKRYGYQ